MRFRTLPSRRRLMRMTPRGPSSKAVQHWSVVVFRIGGRSLAAKADEVGGVWPWQPGVAVPSKTPFVSAIVRRGDQVLPVFDLAARLKLRVKAGRPLCLIARHRDGPMAICIDDDVPTLQHIEPGLIGGPTDDEPDVIGTFQINGETVSIYSLATLHDGRGRE